MLTVEEWMDLKALALEGCSIREIARRTGYSRNTVRRMLAQKAPERFQAPQRQPKLDPYKDYVGKRYGEYGLSAVRLLLEIQPMGYRGSIDVVRRHLATLKPQRQAQKTATVRFETPAGRQGQVDWGYCGTFSDPAGNLVRVDVFVMVLGFSRAMYAEFTTSMAVQELLRCHINAFAFFGGWPKELLYDNMAQVKLPQGGMHPLFMDFCGHYSIVPRLCQVRRPRTKGKVERMVDYLKDNFRKGRTAIDMPDLNTQLRWWLEHTANVRVHATTQQRPVDLLAQEGLTALCGGPPYRISDTCVRKVNAESYMMLDRSRYSVPPEHVGKSLVVEREEQRVIVRTGDLVVAEHPRACRPGSCMTRPEHMAELWRRSVGAAQKGVQESGAPAPPRWDMTFEQEVARTPLERYEQVASQACGAASASVRLAGSGAVNTGCVGADNSQGIPA